MLNDNAGTSGSVVAPESDINVLVANIIEAEIKPPLNTKLEEIFKRLNGTDRNILLDICQFLLKQLKNKRTYFALPAILSFISPFISDNTLVKITAILITIASGSGYSVFKTYEVADNNKKAAAKIKELQQSLNITSIKERAILEYKLSRIKLIMTIYVAIHISLCLAMIGTIFIGNNIINAGIMTFYLYMAIFFHMLFNSILAHDRAEFNVTRERHNNTKITKNIMLFSNTNAGLALKNLPEQYIEGQSNHDKIYSLLASYSDLAKQAAASYNASLHDILHVIALMHKLGLEDCEFKDQIYFDLLSKKSIIYELVEKELMDYKIFIETPKDKLIELTGFKNIINESKTVVSLNNEDIEGWNKLWKFIKNKDYTIQQLFNVWNAAKGHNVNVDNLLKDLERLEALSENYEGLKKLEFERNILNKLLDSYDHINALSKPDANWRSLIKYIRIEVFLNVANQACLKNMNILSSDIIDVSIKNKRGMDSDAASQRIDPAGLIKLLENQDYNSINAMNNMFIHRRDIIGEEAALKEVYDLIRNHTVNINEVAQQGFTSYHPN